MDQKRCPTCAKQILIDQFFDHVDICQIIEINDDHHDENEYVTPVDSLDEQSDDEEKSKRKSIVKSTVDQLHCFQCENSIDENGFVMNGCPLEHVYCFRCFYSSMNDCVKREISPLCHPDRCSYRLSVYDLQMVPMKNSIYEKLKNFIREKHRRKCSLCQFYVDAETDEDFLEHCQKCVRLIDCENCFCPIEEKEFGEHRSQCQNDRRNLIEKLTNFLLNRTKYFYREDQLFLFIRKEFIDSGQHLNARQINEKLTLIPSDCL